MSTDSPGWVLLLLVLIIGTTARLTRLVTADTIFDPVRAWIKAKVKANTSTRVWHKVDDLLVCPWCVSVYTGAGTAYVAWFHADRGWIIAGMAALTASWLTGNVQVREPDPLPAKAESVARLVEAGFTDGSAVAAVESGDLSKLRLS